MAYGYGGGSGRSINPRIAIGVIIAIIGVVGYFMKTQTNPVTGEKQRVSLTVDQEIRLGLQSAPQMAAQMGGVVSASDPRAKLVKETGQRLAAQLPRENPYRFDFHLLRDNQTINAFALPGGQIFITVALYEKLETQAQLAGVLGHEIGHVINRHSAEHMAKSQLGGALVTAVAVGASDERGGGMSAAMIGQVVNQMIQMKYGRNDESESDDYGLKMMADAGFNPQGMLGVMRVLKEASKGNRQPEFMSTHPDPGNRAEKVKAFLEKNYPKGVPATLTDGVPLR